MPRMRLTLPGNGTPWTKVPNALTDRLMPTLRDTELRVLLTLIRSTTGFNRDGMPVPLTYRRLMLLTGRRGEAVGKALEALSERGLIHIVGARRIPLSGQRRTGNRQATNKDK